MADESLPVWSIMDSLMACIGQHRNIVLAAPTGSGKSTQVPQALYRAGYADKGPVFVAQPRRIACRAVARRVADELGVVLGEEVGYWVKDDKCTGPRTKLCFVTDGMLLRLIQHDRILSTSSVIVFDEFHERRIPSDLALSLARIGQGRRSDLRLIAMSATLDPGPVAAYLDADRIEAQGRTYDVEIEYADRPSDLNALDAVVADAIERVCREDASGYDVLAFLPGKLVIDDCRQSLEKRRIPGVSIVSLYGEMTRTEQDQALAPVDGRKVILATNIAETSLTIPGVSIVIDGGFERRIDFDPETGANRMSTSLITVASANQRTGRAGRERPGYCLRLWTRAEHTKLEPFLVPEIRRKDVGDVLLSLKAAGVEHPRSFPLLESPSPAQFEAAENLLRLLGALDADGELTPTGWRMTQLPPALSPRFARMVVEAERSRCVREIATIAALMSGKPIEVIPVRERSRAREVLSQYVADGSSDFYTMLEIFRHAREAEFHPEWCRERYLNADSLRQAMRLSSEIIRDCIAHRSTLGPQRAPRAALVRCIASGMPDRLAKREQDGRYRLSSGPTVKLQRGTVVDDPEYALAGRIVFVASDAAAGDIGRISELTRVELPVMEELFPSLFERSHAVIGWDAMKDLARVEIGHRYGSIALGSENGWVDRDAAIDVARHEALEAAKTGWVRGEIRFDEERRLVARVEGLDVRLQTSGIPTPGPYWVVVTKQGERSFATLQRRIVDIPKPGEGPVSADERPGLRSALAKLLGE